MNVVFRKSLQKVQPYYQRSMTLYYSLRAMTSVIYKLWTLQIYWFSFSLLVMFCRRHLNSISLALTSPRQPKRRCYLRSPRLYFFKRQIVILGVWRVLPPSKNLSGQNNDKPIDKFNSRKQAETLMELYVVMKVVPTWILGRDQTTLPSEKSTQPKWERHT